MVRPQRTPALLGSMGLTQAVGRPSRTQADSGQADEPGAVTPGQEGERTGPRCWALGREKCLDRGQKDKRFTGPV